MRNNLLIVTLVVILLGVAVGTPLYVLGKQKTELKDTVSVLENAIAALQATVAGLEATIAEQGDTIAELEAEKEARLSQAQELYDFATSALEMAEEMTHIRSYAITVPGGTASEITKSINRLLEIENSLEWLYAPPDIIEIKDSLLRELELTEDYLQMLIFARQAWDEGDESAYKQWAERAINLKFQEIYPLEDKNRRDLINLQLQAEQDLNQ